MTIDRNLLYQFEKELNPQDLENSPITATVLGFGEISTIFQIEDNASVAYKRMPLFSTQSSAERYARQYHEYCRLLEEAGLRLPDHETIIIQIPNRPVVIYIAQKQFPLEHFGHRLIHRLGPKDIRGLLEQIVFEIEKVWRFNHSLRPSLELALDGQISNWVRLKEGEGENIYYIDTSTPLYRKEGTEQLDPELLLQSAPSFLRWIIRLLFLEQVTNRYYDRRQVYMDFAANLYKEQRSDLVPLTIYIINGHLSDDLEPLTLREVAKYYREDRLIWTLFLAFRRVDRWLKIKLFRKRYDFILPGKIKR